jgi:hypothetical protein
MGPVASAPFDAVPRFVGLAVTMRKRDALRMRKACLTDDLTRRRGRAQER